MSRKRRRARGFEDGDEPRPDSSELVEWGGELIFAVGITPGGAPYGLTLDEWRESVEQAEPNSAWAIAKQCLQQVAERGARDARPRDARVGRVEKLGSGLTRAAYGAEVELGDSSRVTLVALVPRAGPPAEAAARREVAVLQHLESLTLPFRTPRFAELLPSPRGAVVVQEWMEGHPTDFRASRNGALRPWALVGEVAAALHSVDTAPVASELGGPTTRRAHGAEIVEELGRSGVHRSALAPVRAGLAWMRAHLPPDEPAALLHGDLLGQNVLVYPDARPALVDWERARLGDPAYDLAIVTRGVKRPFQVEGGLTKLLEAYRAHGGVELRESDVRFHECALLIGWCEERQARPECGYLARLANVLRAVGA